MATSNLLTFYDQIAASAVTVEGVTPTVYNLTELKQSVDTADLPVRLLLPTSRRGASNVLSWVTIGHVDATIRWTITDLMLWTPVGQTRGIIDVAEDLVTYSKKYVEMAIDLVVASGKAATLENLETTIATVPWPGPDDPQYWGVECVLTIDETIGTNWP